MKTASSKTYTPVDIFTAGDLIEILSTVPPDTQIVIAHSEVRTRVDGDGVEMEYDYCETGYISHIVASPNITFLHTEGLEPN